MPIQVDDRYSSLPGTAPSGITGGTDGCGTCQVPMTCTNLFARCGTMYRPDQFRLFSRPLTLGRPLRPAWSPREDGRPPPDIENSGVIMLKGLPRSQFQYRKSSGSASWSGRAGSPY